MTAGPIALATLLPWLDVAGLAVFAASGALAAIRKRLDIVGACFFALVTATGGGTLRDLLIGAPVFWMRDPAPVVLCLLVAVAAWALPLRWWPQRALEWLDAAGLAAYAVYGAGKALEFGVAPISAAAAGITTACLGGVIRDVAAGVPSVLIRHELYVTAALAAAGLFVVLVAAGLTDPWPALIGTAAGFVLRGAAIRWRLTLRPHRGPDAAPIR
ncbi:trimeric intracellular cation channel family protein [Methylobacterium sp. JK268]